MRKAIILCVVSALAGCADMPAGSGTPQSNNGVQQVTQGEVQRQQDRTKSKVQGRIDQGTDQTVDSVVDKALGKIFGN
jgi:hypothetical protein